LVLKVAPDLTDPEIEAIADAVRRHGIEGLIATNTSTSREGVEGLRHANEAGGLSGAPITRISTRVLARFSRILGNSVTLIGCGGILSREDACEKIAAGASLVQLYTGLVYRGPDLVSECASAFRAR
jgi:dihydroorotate dehydrogenase